MKIKTKLLVLLALCCALLASINTLGGGWGIERGRAGDGDAVRLISDQTALARAQRRIDEAVARPLGIERQKQLLGISDDGVPTDLMNKVFNWWLEAVMKPAEDIAGNPAASCEEAKIAIQTLLGMMRQRQLLGMSPDEDDKSYGNAEARDMDGELSGMLEAYKKMAVTRCREEALDECIMTGRFDQIIKLDFGMARQDDLLGSGSDIDSAWSDNALKQCAIYELHSVSTTKIAQIFNMETVFDAKVKLEFESGESGIVNALLTGRKLKEMLKGETKGGSNPFLVSVKCSQPPLELTCSPGAAIDPVRVKINTLELRHREFYVDEKGISKERFVGEDKFSYDFAGGIFSLTAVLKIPGGGTQPLPFPGLGFGFYSAHNKDRTGEGHTVMIGHNKRGGGLDYPVIFEFTYADQGNESGVQTTDSTVFKLIHKPKPEPLKRTPERTRKPLKSRPKSGG